jgi:magnesium-transporting ATPase (P-type)
MDKISLFILSNKLDINAPILSWLKLAIALVLFLKIDFDKNNQYDLELEAQWESAVTECRKHTYFINPNDSILFGFFLIINLVFIFLLNIVISNFVNIDKILFFACCIFAIALLIWLILNLWTLRRMFKKESTIKAEFDEIEKQHQLVDKVLNKER